MELKSKKSKKAPSFIRDFRVIKMSGMTKNNLMFESISTFRKANHLEHVFEWKIGKIPNCYGQMAN